MTDDSAPADAENPGDAPGPPQMSEVLEILRDLDVGVHDQSVAPIGELTTKEKDPDYRARREELAIKRLEERVKQLVQDTRLRGPYAWTILIATGVQIVVADVVFVVYAWRGVDWKIPPAAISAWLGAVVIQVIGVVLVVTRYLFPGGGADDPKD